MDKKETITTVIGALQDFGQSFLEALEVEWIDLEKQKEQGKFPASYFIVNASLDLVLRSLHARAPEMCPPLREHRPSTEEKK